MADIHKEISQVIVCRHCGAKNRIYPEKALNSLDSTICGSCKKNIFFGEFDYYREMNPEAYVHPLDKQALNALKKVPGTGSVLKFILKELPERYFRMFLYQNYIRVHEKHFKEAYELLNYSTKMFDLKDEPEMFIYQDPKPNAFTYGVDKPYIGISTGLIDLLDEKELLGVIGHEVGHIHCNHVLYRTAAWLLMILIGKLANYMFGVGSLVLQPIYYAMMYWIRCSELSADRAELLTIRNFDKSLKINMKLAGGSQKYMSQLDAEEYLKQARETEQMQEDNFLNKVFSTLQTANQTHPFPIWRAGHLEKWAYEGEFLAILSGQYAKTSDDDKSGFKEEEFEKDKDNSIIDTLKKLFNI